MNKEDIYLAILRFGKAKGVIGVTYDELYIHLYKNEYITQEELAFFNERQKPHGSTRDKWLNICRLFEESFPVTNNGRRLMSMDSYFKLIEHQELVDAKNNSLSAKRFSYAAIFIAVIAPTASLYFAYEQSQKPITLSEAQVNILKYQPFDKDQIIDITQKSYIIQKSSNELLKKASIELSQIKSTLQNGTKQQK